MTHAHDRAAITRQLHKLALQLTADYVSPDDGLTYLDQLIASRNAMLVTHGPDIGNQFWNAREQQTTDAFYDARAMARGRAA